MLTLLASPYEQQAPIYFNFSSGLSLVMMLATFAGLYKTFEKMDEPGWKGLVPFYNTYIMFKKVWDLHHFYLFLLTLAGIVLAEFLAVAGMVMADNGSYFLLIFSMMLLFVCLVAVMVINVMLDVRLAKAFNKNGWFAFGLIIMPAVFYLILGFDDEKFLYRERKSEWRKME